MQNVRPKFDQIWWFHLRDFCIWGLVLVFLTGLKWVGLCWKKVMSCTSVHQSEFRNIWIRINDSCVILAYVSSTVSYNPITPTQSWWSRLALFLSVKLKEAVVDIFITSGYQMKMWKRSLVVMNLQRIITWICSSALWSFLQPTTLLFWFTLNL